jgi:HAD superfamily hydrolase (TIGR01509 family)
MLRGIVFDMDGVIINSHPAHRKAWQEFLGTLGRRVSEVDLDFILEGRKRQDILRHFLGEMSDLELQEYGKRKDEFFQKIAEEVEPVSGIVEFLRDLEQCGIPAGVATSASEHRTHFTLERLGLARYFQVVVTGDDVAEGKPNPAIYQTAARLLNNLPPEDLLALEDAPRGVEAAISAGLRCVGVAVSSKAEALRQAGAEHVILDFVGLSVGSLEQILGEQEVSASRHGT